MPETTVPDCVRRLLWDVELGSVDLERHRDYVLERIMSRGTWDAMCWLRASYDDDAIADFLHRSGSRLTARDRAYWSLIAGLRSHQSPQVPGGGRPVWAG